MSLYRKDAEKGLLCVRCVNCNNFKGNRFNQESYRPSEIAEIPF
jgi:hypothetical protein